MAIYHFEAKVISRGTGRSAVAAAAYISCSAIFNDYDGVQHDYTKKQGLVWQRVFLPEYAPAEWADRAVLWNDVEENEKTKDSRLAREFVAALPVELNKDEWTALLTDFIQRQFVADGMCADVCIHDADGHNPHAHIMLTVCPLDEKGRWQYKTEKEYLCVKNGEKRGFTAAEFKKCAAELNNALKQYAELKEQAKDLDPDELLAARLALHPERERSAASRLQAAYGDEFKAVTLYDSKLDVRNMLGERVQQQRMQKTAPTRREQREHRDMER